MGSGRPEHSNKRHKFQIDVEIDDDFLESVLISALEGGTGYWARVSEWSYEKLTAVLHELNEDETGYAEEGLLVSSRTLVRGIWQILNGTVDVSDQLRDWIYQAVRENDAGLIDADCADVIVQSGLFMEVKYG